jgi:hypothetical protein
MIISSCADCNHSNICKYRDEYERVINDITVSVPEPFTLVLNCKHYYSTASYLNYQLNNCSNSTAQCAHSLDSLRSAGSEFTY